MNTESIRHEYDWAFIRIVPRVDLGPFLNVGIILHARTARFLDMRYRLDRDRLSTLCQGDLDFELIERHLEAYQRLCAGGADLGPLGALPPSERFHWLTAPRSAVLQTSELHSGRTADPASCLEHLYHTCILGAVKA